jgi:hypothetical protein
VAGPRRRPAPVPRASALATRCASKPA